MTKPEMPKKGAPEKMSRDRTKHVLLRMGRYILKYWPLFLLAIILTLVSNQLSLMGPNFSGEAIDAKLTVAPGDGAPIGGLKVTTKDNWFAARPSGTENIYKIYAESFESPDALDAVLSDANAIVDAALQ